MQFIDGGASTQGIQGPTGPTGPEGPAGVVSGADLINIIKERREEERAQFCEMFTRNCRG